jgi:hypothetical protein
MKLKIFVEGVADEKFLKDYLSHLNIDKDDFLIIKTEGWTNLSQSIEKIEKQMEETLDDGGVNLLIFDADDNFNDRLSSLNDIKNSHSLQFEMFLWPNNSDSGDLESVLENIINPNNSPIFDCWNSYETCLKSKIIVGRNTPLTTPAKKTKIYGYLEALLGNSASEKEKLKEKKRDYKNKDFWNLDSEYLSSLKDFIESHLN